MDMKNILTITYKVFNNDWDLLQLFLKNQGYPKYQLFGDVFLDMRSDIITLGNLISITGNLRLWECKNLKSLGSLVSVTGDLNLYNTRLKDLGKVTTIGGYLDITDSQIESLNNLKKIGGTIYLSGSKIKSFGKLSNVDFKIFPEKHKFGNKTYIYKTYPDFLYYQYCNNEPIQQKKRLSH